MGYTEEPRDVDFTVVNRETAKEERQKLSDFIDKRKKEIAEMRER